MCSLWLSHGYSGLNRMKDQRLLRHDCVVYGGHAKPSSIQHADVSFGIYFAHYIFEGETPRCFYESLLYTNAVTMFHCSKAYGEIIMTVIAYYFKMYAFLLDLEGESCDRRAQNVCIVPANVYCFRFINNRHYLDEEKPFSSGKS